MTAFHLPQRLVVPLFQRPYVWNEEEQWAPLWQDIHRTAELHLADPHSNATHFLGAVVLQADENSHGRIQTSNVIDGQQRITTLQLLMDSATLVLEQVGLDRLAGELSMLTHNPNNFVPTGESALKLRHTNRDRAAFDEVMDAEPPVSYAKLRHSSSLITRAHEYFSAAIDTWLKVEPLDVESRAQALVSALSQGLQLVIINLSATENSQEIFETLNARGTPLTSADLIKNFVFQKLGLEGVDTSRAYVEDWPFDDKFWEKEISVGRYLTSRSSLFFNQWLVSKTGSELSPNSTFTRFKAFVDHETTVPMSELLRQLGRQANYYREWTEAAATPDRQLTVVEMAVYRMQANNIELLKPVLLWLHEDERGVPSSVIDEVVASMESWVVRRQLLRLTSSDLGRIVADLIRTNRDAPAAELADRVSSQLSRLSAASTYWPSDGDVRDALITEAVYRRFNRGRLRMLLEAVENRHRAQTNQPQVPRRGYPIEHVLPQKWDSHWPVDGLEAEQQRASHVHRLGNLTLLTKTLNSKVSNGPWEKKRDAFREHDTLLITSRLLKQASELSWGEDSIRHRTTGLIDDLLAIWPVPFGHTGQVLDPQEKEPDWIEVKDLVVAGLLAPGTVLQPRPGRWENKDAVVRADGLIEIDGQTFETPSGAGKHVRGGSTNGWYFWRLADGRTLKDVRAAYRGEKPQESDRFDWSTLHAVLEAIPTGHWTTYGDLASVVGTSAQPIGSHITGCVQCVNAHRVLKSDGSVASNFAWTDAEDDRDPAQMLESEGVLIANGRADTRQKLSADELSELIAS